MSYFVTGATGFIGRNLVERLLEREGTIYVLVREGSRGQARGAAEPLGGADEARIVPVVGDLSQPSTSASPTRTWRAAGRASTTSSTWRRSTT